MLISVDLGVGDSDLILERCNGFDRVKNSTKIICNLDLRRVLMNMYPPQKYVYPLYIDGSKSWSICKGIITNVTIRAHNHDILAEYKNDLLSYWFYLSFERYMGNRKE